MDCDGGGDGKAARRKLCALQLDVDTNVPPQLVVQSPKTPTLCRRAKAVSLDGDAATATGVVEKGDAPRDARSVPNTPKRQPATAVAPSDVARPLLGSNLRRFASNTSISGSQTLKTLPEVMTLQDFSSRGGNGATVEAPVRVRAKGLLERRGSNASLTIELGGGSAPSVQAASEVKHARSVSNLTVAVTGVGSGCERCSSVRRGGVCRAARCRRRSLSNESLYVPVTGGGRCAGRGGGAPARRAAVYPRQAAAHLHQHQQLLSEDFRLHLQNIQYLQTAGSVLSIADLHQLCQEENLGRVQGEFWEIPLNLQEKCLVSGSQSCNRYRGVLPNEHSRVRLPPIQSDNPAPYIHANYIKGPDYSETAYIATQGPMAHTIPHFWHMVYTHQVKQIVMLTDLIENGRSKCELYFPLETDSELHFPPYTVRNIARRELGQCAVREFELSRDNRTTIHTVTHYWFPAWADHELASPTHLLDIALHVLGFQKHHQTKSTCDQTATCSDDNRSKSSYFESEDARKCHDAAIQTTDRHYVSDVAHCSGDTPNQHTSYHLRSDRDNTNENRKVLTDVAQSTDKATQIADYHLGSNHDSNVEKKILTDVAQSNNEITQIAHHHLGSDCNDSNEEGKVLTDIAQSNNETLIDDRLSESNITLFTDIKTSKNNNKSCDTHLDNNDEENITQTSDKSFISNDVSHTDYHIESDCDNSNEEREILTDVAQYNNEIQIDDSHRDRDFESNVTCLTDIKTSENTEKSCSAHFDNSDEFNTTQTSDKSSILNDASYKQTQIPDSCFESNVAHRFTDQKTLSSENIEVIGKAQSSRFDFTQLLNCDTNRNDFVSFQADNIQISPENSANVHKLKRVSDINVGHVGQTSCELDNLKYSKNVNTFTNISTSSDFQKEQISSTQITSLSNIIYSESKNVNKSKQSWTESKRFTFEMADVDKYSTNDKIIDLSENVTSREDQLLATSENRSTINDSDENVSETYQNKTTFKTTSRFTFELDEEKCNYTSQFSETDKRTKDCDRNNSETSVKQDEMRYKMDRISDEKTNITSYSDNQLISALDKMHIDDKVMRQTASKSKVNIEKIGKKNKMGRIFDKVASENVIEDKKRDKSANVLRQDSSYDKNDDKCVNVGEIDKIKNKLCDNVGKERSGSVMEDKILYRKDKSVNDDYVLGQEVSCDKNDSKCVNVEESDKIRSKKDRKCDNVGKEGSDSVIEDKILCRTNKSANVMGKEVSYDKSDNKCVKLEEINKIRSKKDKIRDNVGKERANDDYVMKEEVSYDKNDNKCVKVEELDKISSEKCSEVKKEHHSAPGDEKQREICGETADYVDDFGDVPVCGTVVHCSAGVGRTGCFLAVLNGLRQLRANRNVDVLAVVCSLRLARGALVQTADQYRLAHTVLDLYAQQLAHDNQ